MKQTDDETPTLPDFHRAWEPAPPRERKAVPTRRRATFRDAEAPHFDKRRRRRAVIKAALESVVTGDKASPGERAAARRLLRDLGRIERERPDTTLAGMVPFGVGYVAIWVFEPELAPQGKTPEAILPRTAEMNRAFRTLRSM